MLLDGSNLWVDGRVAAWQRDLADLAGVAFQGAVEEGVSHALHVVGCFGVGEGLVRNALLQALWSHTGSADAVGRSGITYLRASDFTPHCGGNLPRRAKMGSPNPLALLRF
jgi:hypothetical protein